MSAKDSIKGFIRKFTPMYIARLAMLTSISFILYMFVKFNLPFFPSFLDMQFSELPAILAGFSMGPFAGVMVVVFKCLLKLPFTSTAFVGEFTDMLLGVLYVLPASIIYNLNKSKKTAIVGLVSGMVVSTAGAILVNRYISIPFYVEFFFGGNFDVVVNICKPLYKHITHDNFYAIYLSAAVLPFNLLRLGLVSLITFFVYKPLSKALHWEIPTKKKTEQPLPAEERTNEDRANQTLSPTNHTEVPSETEDQIENSDVE